MQYQESIERSADLLRKALPLMSRQSAGLHPVSYAVWYDYVADLNPRLRVAVDEALARHGQLDERATTALFRQHVADPDPDTAQRVTDGMQQLLSGLARSAELAGHETARFGDSLSRLSLALDTEAERTADAVTAVMADTQQLQRTMSQLQRRLDDNQREIERLRDEVRRARHEASIDPLTQLANRRSLDQAVEACVTARSAAPSDERTAWLLAADIDHFKQVNDTWGHGFGDQVLRAVAASLSAMAPSGALAARTGGEEFALLLPLADEASASGLAEQIRQRVAAARIRRQGSEQVLARVTLSLGATPLQSQDSAVHFLERADQALYASKQGGRNRVTVLPG